MDHVPVAPEAKFYGLDKPAAESEVDTPALDGDRVDGEIENKEGVVEKQDVVEAVEGEEDELGEVEYEEEEEEGEDGEVEEEEEEEDGEKEEEEEGDGEKEEDGDKEEDGEEEEDVEVEELEGSGENRNGDEEEGLADHANRVGAGHPDHDMANAVEGQATDVTSQSPPNG